MRAEGARRDFARACTAIKNEESERSVFISREMINTKMIEIKNLTKVYGDIVAVNDISFTVEKNEILGFLGPNGAGKSTTMNMIAGYLPCTSGTVLINGFDIVKSPLDAKKHIGYLPELPPLYQDMKVLEYLKFCAGIKGVAAKDKKQQIADAMQKLKITDMQDRIIKNLSKGYRQRVGFAQAIIGSPDVLILDEPTVGLDPNQILEVRSLIKSLKKDHTVIFSSHILAEVSAVCDRVVIIDRGNIKAIDTPWNLAKNLDVTLTISLTVKGDSTTATELIKSINGVRRVGIVSELDDSTYRYKAEISEESVRKSVIAKLNENDFEILEITTANTSLEDVFVNITNKQ